MFIIMLGTAGSGKTSLTKVYSEWLRNQGYNVAIVNLDPGAKVVPYSPDFDIRSLFTVEELMVKYGLGPNGAFMKASDMILEYSDKILSHSVFTKPEYEFVIIDTPGQMEVFVYRKSGHYFISKLKKLGPTVGVFIVDGETMSTPIDLVVAWTTSILIQLRLDISVVPIVNKADLIKNVETVKLIVEDIDSFKELIMKSKEGLISETAMYLASIVKEFSQSMRPVIVSAKTSKGIEELHYLIHEAFCVCGDLS
ncbi:MAG: GTPase [Thermoprotei archaeon]|nr:MAG: GTPase [Thermoprotei archaeon]